MRFGRFLQAMCAIVSIQASALIGGVSNNVGASSLEMFQNSWLTYKSVVSADLMEHKSMTARISDAIDDWIVSRQDVECPTTDISIADLGCGDLALLGPLYRSLPLKLFCGVDMSLSALSLAQKSFSESSTSNLQSATFGPKTAWLNDDILSWARTIEIEEIADGSLSRYTQTTQKFDIIICAFSVHHLDDEDKQKFLLALVSNKLKAGGMILMADIFRIDNEDRDEYIERFGNHIDQKWNVISELQKSQVLKHVRQNDFPASLQHFISHTAPECGLSCDLVWSDTGDFEKLIIMKALS